MTLQFTKQTQESGEYVSYNWILKNTENNTAVQLTGHKYKNYDKYLNDAWTSKENQYGFVPQGFTVHSPKPLYNDHTPVKECSVIGCECYSDGSSLLAKERCEIVDPDSDDDYIERILTDVLKEWIK